MYQTQNLILEIIAWYMSKKHARCAHTANKVQSDLPIYNHVIAQNINNLVSVFFLKNIPPRNLSELRAAHHLEFQAMPKSMFPQNQFPTHTWL